MNRLWLVLSFVFVVACSHKGPTPDRKLNDAAHQGKPVVIMISLDGFRHDYVQKYDPPNLKKFIEGGSQAEALIPIYPSLTFPNHYTLVTGLTAEHHGLVGNHFYDPQTKREYSMMDGNATDDGTWYGGVPLWSAAELEGMVSASYFWVGSQAEIAGKRPSYWYKFDDTVPHSKRIDQTIEWLKWPDSQRPHLILLYFSEVDSAGHKYGPDSPEVKQAVLDIDKDLGVLFERVKETKVATDIIIVSDHGMQLVDTKKSARPVDAAVNKNDFKIYGGGPQMYLYAKDKSKIDRTMQKLKKIEKNFKAYKKEDIPERYHLKGSARAPDILIDAQIPYAVGLKERFEKPKVGGVHGFDNREKNMWGIFYASGPNFKAGGKIAPVENTNVAPLVIRILGLSEKRQLDGNADVFSPIIE